MRAVRRANSYRVGSTIKYLTFGDQERTVVVTNKEADIKNGKPGFDGTIVGETLSKGITGVWGYDEQITEVVEY